MPLPVSAGGRRWCNSRLVEETAWPPTDRVHLAQAAIVVALVVVAALGWLLTHERMAGMDEGPGTDPGSLGFYVSVWVVMMAAMMLPSAAPMVVVHSAVQRRRRELGRDGKRGGSVAFVGGYLLVWTAFGIVAYALFEFLRSLDVDALSWSRDGRYVAAAVIAIAAIYQLTPLKDVCLARALRQLGRGERIPDRTQILQLLPGSSLMPFAARLCEASRVPVASFRIAGPTVHSLACREGRLLNVNAAACVRRSMDLGLPGG